MVYCNYRATGNGNCLFNACSIALIGDESISIYLRCLTSIEMFKWSNHYANHPMIYGQYLHGKKINENAIFSITISQIAFQLFRKDFRISPVQAEAVNVAKNFTYSPFLSVLALSSAIGRPIESYYPIENEAAGNVYEMLFNCTVNPRIVESQEELQSHGSVHIFRCAYAPLDYTVYQLLNFPLIKIILFPSCQLI